MRRKVSVRISLSVLGDFELEFEMHRPAPPAREWRGSRRRESRRPAARVVSPSSTRPLPGEKPQAAPITHARQILDPRTAHHEVPLAPPGCGGL